MVSCTMFFGSGRSPGEKRFEAIVQSLFAVILPQSMPKKQEEEGKSFPPTPAYYSPQTKNQGGNRPFPPWFYIAPRRLISAAGCVILRIFWRHTGLLVCQSPLKNEP